MKTSFVLGMAVFVGLSHAAWANRACFEVSGMTCATCPITVKTAVKKLEGIHDVKVSLEEKNASVDFDPKKVVPDDIKNAIDATGFKATPKKCLSEKGV